MSNPSEISNILGSYCLPLHLGLLSSAPKGYSLLTALFPNQRNVQLEGLGVGYTDPPAFVSPRRSEMAWWRFYGGLRNSGLS